jgi:Flp pilus assembly protein TadG
MSSLLQLFRKLRRDRRGAVAIVFALAALPMVGAAGVAIDMANVGRVKARMQAAADAAALAGARAFNAPGMESNVQYSMDAARDRAAGFFAANIDKAFIDSPAETTIDVDPSTYDKLTVTITYHGVVPTGVMSFFKIPQVKFSGAAKAAVIMPNYIDVYFVLDVTGSMGRPLTTAGLSDLEARYASVRPTFNYNKCTCACHEAPNWLSTDMPTNGWNLARAVPPIDLKIDAAKRALNQIVTAAKSQSLYNHVNFAFYTMASTTLTKISDLTANYDAITASINAVDTVTDQGTDFSNLLASFDRNVSNELTRTTRSTYLQFGKSSSGRKTYVFFVTDGLDVTILNWGSEAAERLYSRGIAHPAHKGGAFDPSLCQRVKDKNVSVGVIYVEGANDSGNPTHDYLEQPYVADAVANLNSCASPGYFIDATWSTDNVYFLTSKLFSNMGDDVLVRLTK